MRAWLLFVVALVACGDEPKRPLGESCEGDGECVSGLCSQSRCLDPDADDDGDTLTNGLEASLGSNPLSADSDDDGVPDRVELDEAVREIDTDGDGIPDIIESAIADADDDCIADQYDAQNDVPNPDLSPLRDVVCRTEGICAGAAVVVVCPDGKSPFCDYGAVVGFAHPEATCDGRDENCDGEVDEGFADADEDGIADCVDGDADGDGAADVDDNCPGLANATQVDAEGDGIGDACVAGLRLVVEEAPTSVVAGEPFALEAAVVDAGGNAVVRFVGSVTVGVTEPVTHVFGAGDGGRFRFEGLTLATAGAIDLGVASAGFSTTVPIEVVPGPARRLELSGPAVVVAGTELALDVVVFDAFDNQVVGFDEDIALSGGGLDEVRAAVGGEARFEGLVLTTVGPTTLTASSGEAVGEHVVEVTLGSGRRPWVEAPAQVVAGEAFTIVVEVRDDEGNRVRDFVGSVGVTVEDVRATAPSVITFGANDEGRREITGVVLVAAGQSEVVFELGDVDVRQVFEVAPAALAAIEVTGLGPRLVAGTGYVIDAQTRDRFGNAVAYSGPATLAGMIGTQSIDFVAGRASVDVTPTVAGDVTYTINIGAVRGSISSVVEAGALAAIEVALAHDERAAGVATSAEIVLRDAHGNVVTGFVGALVLGTEDAAATVPASVVVDAGDAGRLDVAGLVFRTAGTQVLSVTSGLVVGSDSLNVTPGAETRLVLEAPVDAVAGEVVAATLRAEDVFGNAKPGYRGSIVVTSDDAAAVLPAVFAFAAGDVGVKALEVTFVTAGARTLRATDRAVATITTSAAIEVAAGALVGMTFDGVPGTASAGSSHSLSVRLVDAHGNTLDVGGSGALTGLAASEGPSTLVFTNGTAAFTVRFETAGARALVATRDGRSANASTTVNPGVATSASFVLADERRPAGVATSGIVTLSDAYGNVASGYRGRVAITSGDAAAMLPVAYTFTAGDAGRRTFAGITLATVGTYSVVASDGTLSATDTLGVDPGNDTRLVVTAAPTSVVAGTAFSVSIAVRDAFGNTRPAYTGTVGASVDDTKATLPAAWTFAAADAGEKSVSGFVLGTVGTRNLQFTDAADASITIGTSIEVTPGAVASIVVSGLETQTTAGVARTLSAATFDAFGNPTPFTGAATLTGMTGNEGPTGVSFSGGAASFGVTLTTVGARTLTVSVGAVSGSASTTVVASTLASIGLVGLPANTSAGATHSLTATTRDAQNNVVAYNGNAVVTGLGANEGPTTITLVNGTATFDVTLRTSGDRFVTVVIDALSKRLDTVVAPGVDIGAFVFSGLPGATTAGTTHAVSVAVKDVYGNAHAFSGSLPLGGVAVGEGPQQVVFTSGAATFDVTLKTVGARTVSVQSGAVTGQASTTVSAAVAASITIVLADVTRPAGAATSATVTVHDAFGNVATGFTGVVGFDSDDDDATLPTGYTFTAGDAGVHVFGGVVFRTVGTQSIEVVSGAMSASDDLEVTPGADAVLVVTQAPTTIAAGAPFALTFVVQDTFGNPKLDYRGTVGFVSNDPNATLPGAVTFTAGDNASKTVSGLVLEKVATATIDLTDVATPAITTRATIAVGAGGAESLVVGLGHDERSGDDPTTVTVTAYDAYGNVASGYRGTVRLTSLDPSAALAPNYTFTAGDAGGHVFNNQYLRTVGTQTVTVTDTVDAGITGQDALVVVESARPHFLVTQAPPSVAAGGTANVTILVRDAWGNTKYGYRGTVVPSADDPLATVPAAHTFVAGDNATATFAFVLKTASTTNAVRFTDEGDASVTTSRVIDVIATTIGSFVFSGLPATTSAGATHSVSVAIKDPYGNALAYTGSFPMTGLSAAEGPTTVAFTNGLATFDVTLTTTGARTLRIENGAASGQASTTVQPGAGTVLVLSELPVSATAGAAFNVRLSVRDTLGNPKLDYVGTVRFASAAGTGLPDVTFGAGDNATKVVGLVLRVAGPATISATDVATPSITTAASIEVNAGPLASIVLTGMPTETTAGSVHQVGLTTYDAYNNLVPYTGNAAIDGILTGEGLPSVAVSNGTATIDFMPRVAGERSWLVSIGPVQTVPQFTVLPGEPAVLVASGLPEQTTAGTFYTVDLLLQDAYGNTVEVDAPVASSGFEDGEAPASIDLVDGYTTFEVLPLRAGERSLTLSYGAVEATLETVVAPGGLRTIEVTGLPATVTAGVQRTLTARALDEYGNVTGYGGSGNVDGLVTGEGANTTTFTAGVATFQVTLTQAGERGVVVRIGAVVGSASTLVLPGSVHRVELSPYEPTMEAGVGTQTITAWTYDAYDNLASYDGTVVVEGADPGEAPDQVTFVDGEATISPTFYRAGERVLVFSVEGIVAVIEIEVVPSMPERIELTHGLAAETELPATTVAGTYYEFVATLYDYYDNIVDESGVGTFQGLNPDPDSSNVEGSESVEFEGGVAEFGVMLMSAGERTLTIEFEFQSDTLTTNVVPAELRYFSVEAPLSADPTTIYPGTAFSALVEARDVFDNPIEDYVGTVVLRAGDDDAAVMPPAYSFTAADGGLHTFVGIQLYASGFATLIASDDEADVDGEVIVEVTPGACDDGVCQNGGECLDDGDGGYSCDCLEGWDGDNCETSDGCASATCDPPQVCVDDGAGSYTCEEPATPHCDVDQSTMTTVASAALPEDMSYFAFGAPSDRWATTTDAGGRLWVAGVDEAGAATIRREVPGDSLELMGTFRAEVGGTVDLLPDVVRGPNGRLYRAGFASPEVVLVSTDEDGVSEPEIVSTAVTAVLEAIDAPVFFISGFDIDPDGVVYVSGMGYGGSAAGTWILLRSTDEGASWASVYTSYGEGGAHGAYGVRVRSDEVYLVGIEDFGTPRASVLRSVGGGDFEQVFQAETPNASQGVIQVRGDGRLYYRFFAGGRWRVNVSDDGAFWSSPIMPLGYVIEASFVDVDGNYVAEATDSEGAHRVLTLTLEGDWIEGARLPFEGPHMLAPDPERSEFLWALEVVGDGEATVLRSQDGGSTFELISAPTDDDACPGWSLVPHGLTVLAERVLVQGVNGETRQLCHIESGADAIVADLPLVQAQQAAFTNVRGLMVDGDRVYATGSAVMQLPYVPSEELAFVARSDDAGATWQTLVIERGGIVDGDGEIPTSARANVVLSIAGATHVFGTYRDDESSEVFPLHLWSYDDVHWARLEPGVGALGDVAPYFTTIVAGQYYDNRLWLVGNRVGMGLCVRSVATSSDGFEWETRHEEAIGVADECAYIDNGRFRTNTFFGLAFAPNRDLYFAGSTMPFASYDHPRQQLLEKWRWDGDGYQPSVLIQDGGIFGNTPQSVFGAVAVAPNGALFAASDGCRKSTPGCEGREDGWLLRRSIDNGASWRIVDFVPGVGFATGLAIDPASGDVLVSGLYGTSEASMGWQLRRWSCAPITCDGQPTEETCNGVDDDCDGEVDDEGVCF